MGRPVWARDGLGAVCRGAEWLASMGVPRGRANRAGGAGERSVGIWAGVAGGRAGGGGWETGASKKQSLSGPEKNPDLLCNDACLEQPLKQALKQEKK